MITVSIILLLLVLIAIGLPLFFAIGISSMVYFWTADINLALMTQRMTGAVDSFLILAIPFFFLAGELMNACKLTDRIINLARALVGHIHGGLAQVNIFASLIFSGMSGSPTADTTALGSVLIPAMKREGLSRAVFRGGHRCLLDGRPDGPALGCPGYLRHAGRRLHRPPAPGWHPARYCDHRHPRCCSPISTRATRNSPNMSVPR